ncbi:MAG: sensor histidine kinase [Dermatophilaceae bacterium]
MSETQPSTTSRSPGPPRSESWRWGTVFAAIWLLYLADVVEDALSADTVARSVAGLGSVLVFAGAYLWTWHDIRRLRRQGATTSTVYRTVVLLVMLACVVVAALAVGENALTMLVFVAVTTMFLFPMRWALLSAAVLTASVVVLPRVVPGWEYVPGLAFSVALAALAMFGIRQMLDRQTELAAAQREIAALAIVNERTRFARDLHDILGHSLTVLTVKSELAGRLMDVDPDRARSEITQIEQLARQALSDVRTAVAGYREVTLASELASARSALDAAGIEADIPSAVDAVPAERRELFGWAVREGVTNVVRHSGARHCAIRVSPDAVEVVDDGHGPAPAPVPTGGPARATHCLTGLSERAAAAGASVLVGRRDGGGFWLRVGW